MNWKFNILYKIIINLIHYICSRISQTELQSSSWATAQDQ